ncbi:hypothetical protein HPB51_029449 [Rhipicephalus microplus]|uniref:Uncharacterized protein n=1 Tax=Rhipicephalus microplus TaxID=6941 RepID=A0A9J6CU60_RHIMP|nr:hypothetical protein HPB51_029449 [Rhipicephalus microplus]
MGQHAARNSVAEVIVAVGKGPQTPGGWPEVCIPTAPPRVAAKRKAAKTLTRTRLAVPVCSQNSPRLAALCCSWFPTQQWTRRRHRVPADPVSPLGRNAHAGGQEGLPAAFSESAFPPRRGARGDGFSAGVLFDGYTFYEYRIETGCARFIVKSKRSDYWATPCVTLLHNCPSSPQRNGKYRCCSFAPLPSSAETSPSKHSHCEHSSSEAHFDGPPTLSPWAQNSARSRWAPRLRKPRRRCFGERPEFTVVPGEEAPGRLENARTGNPQEPPRFPELARWISCQPVVPSRSPTTAQLWPTGLVLRHLLPPVSYDDVSAALADWISPTPSPVADKSSRKWCPVLGLL